MHRRGGTLPSFPRCFAPMGYLASSVRGVAVESLSTLRAAADPGFVRQTVSTILPTMVTEPLRRLSPANGSSTETRARAFAETLATAKGKHVLIALRGHPDPDGIA